MPYCQSHAFTANSGRRPLRACVRISKMFGVRMDMIKVRVWCTVFYALLVLAPSYTRCLCSAIHIFSFVSQWKSMEIEWVGEFGWFGFVTHRCGYIAVCMRSLRAYGAHFSTTIWASSDCGGGSAFCACVGCMAKMKQRDECGNCAIIIVIYSMRLLSALSSAPCSVLSNKIHHLKCTKSIDFSNK